MKKKPCTGFSVHYRKDEESNSTVHEAVIMSDDINIVLDASTMNQLVYDWENPNDEDDWMGPITRYVKPQEPKPQKVVIYTTYGVFQLSKAVQDYMGIEPLSGDVYYGEGINRDDPKLVAAVEALGPEAEDLRVVEVPLGIEWEIKDYDGQEWVAEKHRIWS
jgi:hypothetical protein